jgi:4-hydroxy-2-oxoheptanedioate aldolase
VNIPTNNFKRALLEQRPQIGMWLAMGSAVSAEICAGAGYDWVLIDGEHGPNDLTTVLAQVQALSGYPDVSVIARIPSGQGEYGETLIKQYLDLGIRTLLAPMIDTAEQAEAVVRAARYPQDDGRGGTRGIGAARAARWGRHPGFLRESNQQVCMLVQAESQLALENLDAIAAVDGVDGVLIGPSDLSASMGYLGAPEHPDVIAAIDDAIGRIRAGGKAAGVFTLDPEAGRHYLAVGATFMGVALDTALLLAGSSQALVNLRG